MRAAAVFTLLTLNTILWVLPLLLLALPKLLLPVPAFRRMLTRQLMRIAEFWISGNALILGLERRNQLEVRGAAGLAPDNWHLVIANHQSWVDIVVLQTALNRRIPLLKFFIKQELVWVPFLGIAWWALDMPFMKRYSKSYLAKHPEKKGFDYEATRAACRKFLETPTSVINFVEGTRFSEAKKRKRGAPFDHLLPPRAGGIALVLASMGEVFDDILDVTIIYPGGVPTFWELCRGDAGKVIIDLCRHPVPGWLLVGDYVADRAFRGRFHRWLTRLWEEKDGRIARLMAETDSPGSRTVSG